MAGFDDAIREGETEIEIAAAAETTIRREFPELFPYLEYVPGANDLPRGPAALGSSRPDGAPAAPGRPHISKVPTRS